MQEQRPHDWSDAEAIVRYAQGLVGKTLRESTHIKALADPHVRRGSFGNAVEEYYFHYKPNSDSAPDFPKAGLELKTTPLKRSPKGEFLAKERLVITMIDYMSVVRETFESSHFMRKASSILLISYLWEPDKDPLDYVVELAVHWGIPERDMPQIRHDWETVANKVRAGKAHEISGSDTLYLEACTKAANSKVRRPQPYSSIPAKPRAWALKASYMTAVQRGLIDGAKAIPRVAAEKDLDLLTLVKRRFSPYVGRTEAQLAQLFGLGRSKDLCARITHRILGVDDAERIEEFVKAGIKAKTLRLKRNGVPKEAMSFPAFDYYDVLRRPFEESGFLACLGQKYLFVVYREEDGEYRLRDVCFWQMPEADLEEARRCYEQMRDNIRRGRADVSVRSTENRCCHVRPHGRTAADTRPQPFGPPVVKKSFWLNQQYLAGEIKRAMGAEGTSPGS